MAQTSKKTTSKNSGKTGTAKKKSTSAAKKKTTSSTAAKKQTTKQVHTNPHRREIGAAVCLLLAIFCFIGFFSTDALFVGAFSKLIKGIIGYGFYVAPISLLACSVILTFHRGHPVRLRVTCALLLCVAIGSVCHIFACSTPLKFGNDFFTTLWQTGIAVKSGGVISGGIAHALSSLFSKFGAVVIFIVASILLVLMSINKTVVDIVDAYKKREKREYIYDEEPEPEQEQEQRPMRQPKSAEPDKPSAGEKLYEKAKKRKPVIDIPVDEEQLPIVENAYENENKEENENDSRSVSAGIADPAEPKPIAAPQPEPIRPPEPLKKETNEFYITGAAQADGINKKTIEPEGEQPPEQNEEQLPTLSEENEDIALDIPFMDGPIKPAPKPSHHRMPAPVRSNEPVRPPEPIMPGNIKPEPETKPEEEETTAPWTEEPQLESDAENEPENETQYDLPQVQNVTYEPEQKSEPEPVYIPVTPPRPAPPEPLKMQRTQVCAAPDNGVKERSLPKVLDIPDVTIDATGYIFPPIELLQANNSVAATGDKEELMQNAKRLESAFKSFGVNVKISNYTHGPSVTRYEAELEPGVKLSKITNLADDIALSIGASGVRIAAMPNKISTVGIEVPNSKVSSVYLREIIESDNFKKPTSKLTFAIGKSIDGTEIVGNIAKLPHLLVAGTTGSGKSVCLNSIILSILYKAKPDEVRFIMIDPKMVEFKVYNGIPHLLIPVVTDAKKAAGAIQWAVTEMLKRYRLFADTTARDLTGYNDYLRKLDDPEQPPLPQIVVVIDELADLMMTAAKEVEDSIVRIAQMGRAAGVHLVIATQSPRADVITGLMKANIPSRIALKVSSSLESRIILDAGGNADKLVGNGDMLYAPIGCSKPLRVQGTWVSDDEREAVIEFVKKQGQTDYSQDVIKEIEKSVSNDEQESKSDDDKSPMSDYDELLAQAVEVIFESKQASSSMLQRRLKVGYTRAARIIDQMEELGIVGPFEGSKPRQLLITHQQWQEMQFINGTAPIADNLPEADDFSQADFYDNEDDN